MSEAKAKQAIDKAAQAQRQATRKTLAKGADTPKVLELARQTLVRAERVIAQVLALMPSPLPIACAAGCPYCCHVRVTVAAPELFLIADYLRRSWGAQARGLLKRRLANIVSATRNRPEEIRNALRLPCALLDGEGRCSIHSVRPLSCRAVVSVDVEACRAAHAKRMQGAVPQHAYQALAADGIGYALYAGLADRGYPIENIDLAEGLLRVIEDDGALARWLAQEPIFG
ncbi:MAG: YkgJ family cysteine cluster protein [Rhodospirillales bacterium]|nr:YkgJ family cysteine cluster protein [Rhodospirillales bacterium]